MSVSTGIGSQVALGTALRMLGRDTNDGTLAGYNEPVVFGS
jgi:hypothetical protein